jgi:hypothetical protein
VFVLFEAMQEPEAQGLHLGMLGSIIVAEVVFAALLRARRSLRLGSGALAEQLAELSLKHYTMNIFSDVPEIESMAQLVAFTAEIADLKQAVPAFL